MINLLEKNHGTDIRTKFESWKQNNEVLNVNDTLGLKAGDVVSFWSGYNNDIEYITEILGFNEEGKAYMYWDCFWFSIDLVERKYQKCITLEHIK